jgi:hypothetical protein
MERYSFSLYRNWIEKAFVLIIPKLDLVINLHLDSIWENAENHLEDGLRVDDLHPPEDGLLNALLHLGDDLLLLVDDPLLPDATETDSFK